MKLVLRLNFLALGFLLIAVSQAGANPANPAPESQTSIEEYVRTFWPYRENIKTWFNQFINDRDPPRSVTPKADFLTCPVCKAGYPVIKLMLTQGRETEEIIQTIVKLCVQLGIETEELCDPTVRSYALPILFIIKNRPQLTVNDLCGILNPGCAAVNDNLTNWDITIDANKPAIVPLNPLPTDLKTTKIMQITDIHVDVEYKVGTNANCGKALCCRDANGLPDSEENAAGPFGHYKCALPPFALDTMLEHARTTIPDVKYVFLTGDYVHSGIWLYNQEENGKNIKYVTEAVAKAFPYVQVYPLTGNHEPDIVNMYAPEELWDQFDLSWMYNLVSSPFKTWLGKEQLTTFKKGGYYSVRPEKGLRLVIVNTNLCYLNNFWLAYNTNDPTGQLQWMSDTLLEAEAAGENVLIVGHINPGSGSCWPQWSDKFDKIVNRFENIIRGQFYGHSHTENFALTFERGTERVLSTSILWTTPSAVTDGMNSGYKVYEADGERGLASTWEIVDHATYILNTTESNAKNQAVFEKLFSAREAYNLKSLRGEELYEMVVKMITDDELFLKFQRHHNKGLTTRGGVCNPSGPNFQKCKMGLLCDCVTSYSGDNSHCEKLEEIRKSIYNN